MKTLAMARAAASIRDCPQRIYEPHQLEACPKVGPEIRRVRPANSLHLPVTCSLS